MKKNILLSQRSLMFISAGIILVAVIGPFFSSSARNSVFVYAADLIVTLFVVGCLAAIITDRINIIRLRQNFKLMKPELDRLGFGSFFRTRGPNAEQSIERIIRKDPDGEQIIAERRMHQKFARYWVYPPSGLLIALIVFYAIKK